MVERLLAPMWESLVGLNPSTQAQLLSLGAAAALSAMQAQLGALRLPMPRLRGGGGGNTAEQVRLDLQMLHSQVVHASRKWEGVGAGGSAAQRSAKGDWKPADGGTGAGAAALDGGEMRTGALDEVLGKLEAAAAGGMHLAERGQ